MNILHIIPGLTWERGGPSAVVRALAEHQAKAGHRVSLLTTDQGERHGERPVELAELVEVERHAVWGSDRVAYAPGFASAVKSRLRTSDVVHIHSIFTYPVHAALRAAAAAGVPAVLRPCGLLHPYSLGRSRWQKRAYLALWGRMVRQACSSWHFTSEQEANASWPFDQSPRFVAPNGIEPADYAVDRDEARAWMRQFLPELQESPYVLFLGRLHAKKRLDLLIEAFLAGAPRAFRLVIAGPDEAGLWRGLQARFLRDTDAASRVLHVGMVAGREKALVLAGASLFALPSEHENFGIAALEALAAGTPVLLSPNVDLTDAALAAEVGYAAPLTVAAWSDRFASLLTGAEGLIEPGRRARRWVAENYSWSRITEELVERYHEVIADNRQDLSQSLARSPSLKDIL
jgi:glycosyltransferase involved in cell wall biosynthesis